LKIKREEAGNSQKPKLAKDHSQEKSNSKKSKPLDAFQARSEENSTEGKVRGVLFCPKCGSTDVFWASGLPQLWSVWDCRNCRYRGALILRDSKLAKKLREVYAKRFAK
jgi:ribosomal protein L37AE/L43A